jgi:hypothetical protein
VNERLFWTVVWPRLLPLQVQGSGAHGELEFNVKIDPAELARKMQERGLPPIVLGFDKPLLELEPPRLNGNGSSEAGMNGNGAGAPGGGNGIDR